MPTLPPLGRRGLRRQHGGIIVLACFVLLFLLGFMGIALDFGRLFIVRNELQTALDSCALAAAQELDAQSDSITRAQNAGIAAAGVNRVNLQSSTWDGKGKVTAADISFRDASYVSTTSATAARYAECSHTQPAIRLWLLQSLGAFSGDSATYPATRSVSMRAVATRASGQSSCPVPVAMIAKPGYGAPDYGYTVGSWIVVHSLHGEGLGDTVAAGEMGWFNLNGSQSAKDTKDELSEGALCGTTVNEDVQLRTQGQEQAAATQWNYRFGLYKGNDGPSTDHPDFSGYEYNTTNWSAGKNAWPDFKTKRLAFTPHSGKAGSYSPTTSAMHQQYGYNRRVVTVPVLASGTNTRVVDFVCMLMLDPMKQPQDPVHMEYLGNASAAGSPCTSSGLAGYVAGPLVPVLVR
ncbi:MAG: pilus assembly protein TadG-related protein [Telluria sp.]